MKSLFSASDIQEMLQRINTLSAGSQVQWGKMSVAQMLAHAQPPFKVALGELQLKKSFAGVLFGRIAKKKLLGPHGFSRNLPTDKQFIVQPQGSIEEEKKALATLVERFALSEPAGLANKTHPFFGKLTPQEWDTLMWKHLDHHLRQFGV